MSKAKDILEKFGKSLDKHYGINDFGCRECDKLVDRALSSLRGLVMACKDKDEIVRLFNDK
jgi:hypothetical protein